MFSMVLWQKEDEFFCMFVRGFVSIWEDILELNWTTFPDWATIKPDGGPHLDRLPEELLSTVSHFMQVAKKQTGEVTAQNDSLLIQLILSTGIDKFYPVFLEFIELRGAFRG